MKFKVIDNKTSPLVELWYEENGKWIKWGGVNRKVYQILIMGTRCGDTSTNFMNHTVA